MPRYRAPQEDGGVVSDPPVADWPRLVADNRRLSDTTAVSIDGTPLARFRELARAELSVISGTQLPAFDPSRPLVLTGHQPELFHPGVWVKNFAAHKLARQVVGTAVNLVVDTDTLKSASVHLPTVSPEPSRVRLVSVPFAAAGPEQPYESRLVGDADLFHDFPRRAAEYTAGWPFRPILPDVWPSPTAPDGQPVEHDHSIVWPLYDLRRRRERAWGVTNVERFVSLMSEQDTFLRFARHLAADADRFRAVYNAVVQSYRAAHRIRSRNHPVADLADGELPFWGPEENGRRTRATEIVPGVRPRALTLTLFARLCLGDFFLHGIGGGKYDELTDSLIRHYFGIEPPRYAVLSATLHLPFEPFPMEADDAKFFERKARDLYWNPHRHLPADAPERVRHRILEATITPTRAGRRHRYRSFRRAADELRPWFESSIAEAKRIAAVGRAHAAANAILRRRDYSWVLHPEATLRPFLTRFLE
jgi:hypothetical protein